MRPQVHFKSGSVQICRRGARSPRGRSPALRRRPAMVLVASVLGLAVALSACARSEGADFENPATGPVSEAEVEDTVGDVATNEQTRRFFDDPDSFVGESVHLVVRVSDLVGHFAFRMSIEEPGDDDEVLAVYDGVVDLREGSVISVTGEAVVFDVGQAALDVRVPLRGPRLRAYEGTVAVLVSEIDLTP